MSGVLMASPPADFQLHNSLFLVAHFHTMIVGVALFGIFAGTTYWFPKIMGFMLDERLGKLAFWFWFIGYFVSFIPLYLLGFMGGAETTRPLFRNELAAALHDGGRWFIIISCGVIAQIIQLIVSIRKRKQHLDTTGDPWNGRTLEWSTSSPPPFYNFATLPQVTSREPFWDWKKNGWKSKAEYKDIELPKNTGQGVYIAAFGLLADLRLFGRFSVFFFWDLSA